MADKDERLDALITGLDVLTQAVASGYQDDPEVRGQLLRLISAIGKFEHDILEDKPSNDHKEQGAKVFKPVLPTPKGKLLQIIESLKRASTTQQPTQYSLGVDDTVQETNAVGGVNCHGDVDVVWSNKSINIGGTDCPENLQFQDTSLATPPSQSSQTPPTSPTSQAPPISHQITMPKALTQYKSLSKDQRPPQASSPSQAVPLPPPPPTLAPPHPKSTLTPYQPVVLLKPLFWKRVQFSSAQLKRVDNVWKHISEPVIGDVEKFVKSFAKKQSTYRPKSLLEKPLASNVRPITVLDGKRSQAIGIMLRSLPCGVSELSEAVSSGDVTLVDRETLQAVYDLQASKKELARIRAHFNSPGPATLDRPEMFLYSLSEVPQFSERLLCVLFSQSLPETSAAIKDKLSIFSRVSEQLQHSKEVNSILGLILALGNIMNSGNKVRGQADGFHIEILPKLRDVKTVDNSSNLLKFLVSSYLHEREKTAVFWEFPLPDPADLMTSAQLDFDLLHSEVSEYSNKVACFDSALKVVLKATPINAREPFKSRMECLLRQVKCEGRDLLLLVSSCQQQFNSLVAYFCVTPPSGQSSVEPAHFFGMWSSFVVQFHEYWKQEKRSLVKEKLRAEELKRRNGALVKPMTSSGLKSRLKSRRSYSASSGQ